MKTDALIPTLEHEMNQTVVLDFIEARKKADALAAEARQQMQAQFQDLLRQAIAIEREFVAHFGSSPELPSGISFGQEAPAAAPAKIDIGHKIGGLRRSLRAAEKHGNRAAIEEITEKLKAFGAVLED